MLFIHRLHNNHIILKDIKIYNISLLSLLNQKGRGGKTTCAINIGAGLNKLNTSKQGYTIKKLN
jgi:hypothetical protein